MVRKWAVCLLAALLALCLTACGSGGGDAFTVQVICESPDIYQIFYTYYLGDEALGMGGMADLEGGEITPDSDLSLTFPPRILPTGRTSPSLPWTSPPTARGIPARSPPRTRWPSPPSTEKPTLSYFQATRPPAFRPSSNPEGSKNQAPRPGIWPGRCSVLPAHQRFHAMFISTFPSMPGTEPLLVYCHMS